jgi:hypothetical protein
VSVDRTEIIDMLLERARAGGARAGDLARAVVEHYSEIANAVRALLAVSEYACKKPPKGR